MQLPFFSMILLSCGLSKVFGFRHFANRIDRRQKPISYVNSYIKMSRLDDLVLDFQDLAASFGRIFQQKSGALYPNILVFI
jgi:hypothetical protein